MATATLPTASKGAKKTGDTDERTTHPVEASKVKKDDLMAIIHYVKVKAVVGTGNTLTVQNLHGAGASEFQIHGKELVAGMLSADQFSEEETVTKTAAAEILISSPNRPLTVCFEKQDGSERVLRGRFLSSETLLGRSKVEDLDLSGNQDQRVRLVDHRTIKWLVVDGVKYVVK